jgi:ankyrin repeat protein
MAIKTKNQKIVQLLLKANAYTDVLGHGYQTPLQTAAFNHDESIVRLLLEATADVNLESRSLRSGKNVRLYTTSLKIMILAID